MKDYINDYYNSGRISQSKLKLLLLGPKKFVERRDSSLYFEEKESLIIGSAVDCLLTQSEEFEKDYYISSLEEKPSDIIKSILKQEIHHI